MSKENKAGTFNKLKALYNSVFNFAPEGYMDVKAEDGRIFRVEGTIMEVDMNIQEVTEDGLVDLTDGSYKMEDGKTIKVEANKITEITDAPESEDEVDVETTEFKFAIVKQISKWEMTVNNESFAVGDKVTMTDSEGNEYSAYAGTYELEDGRIITLDPEGVIVLIQAADGTVEETPTVGEKVDGEVTEAVVEMMSKVVEELKTVKADFAELKAKTPSASHTVQTHKFEEEKPSKPKSKLHEQMGL